MHERAAVQEQRRLERSPQEPRESRERHDRADAALRAPLPGGCAAADQDRPDGEIGDDESEVGVVDRGPRPLGRVRPQRQKREGVRIGLSRRLPRSASHRRARSSG